MRRLPERPRLLCDGRPHHFGVAGVTGSVEYRAVELVRRRENRWFHKSG
jgi:hypothetical protein